MIVLLLALLLDPEYQGEKRSGVRKQSDDFLMTYAVERSVYEFWRGPHPGRTFHLEKVLPDRQARWVRMLNCDHFACRREAMDLILENRQSEDVRRAVIWGSFPELRWPHVIDVCEGLIWSRYLCKECKGEAYCPYCNGTGCKEMGVCTECMRFNGEIYLDPTGCLRCDGTGIPEPKG